VTTRKLFHWLSSRAQALRLARPTRQRRATVSLTTHYLEEADALCDRLIIIDHGKIVIEGSPRDLKRDVAGDAILLSLHDSDSALLRAQSLLEGESYVREVNTEGDQLRLYVEDGSTALPKLMRLLDQERITLRSISLSEPTLDDVFLRETGRSLRDTGASEGVAA
jgi:ABC-2 type transport system ATP-binding protein